MKMVASVLNEMIRLFTATPDETEKHHWVLSQDAFSQFANERRISLRGGMPLSNQISFCGVSITVGEPKNGARVELRPVSKQDLETADFA